MSVEQHLGLDLNLEQVIVGAWPRWAEQRPALGAVADPANLRSWLQVAVPDQADGVLHALAWLASTQGGDDPTAAQALAWLLVPGASFTARQLHSLSRDIDHLVASELWVLVRTFPLRRRKVVANLMRDLRSRVLEACEVPSTLRRTDPTWFATVTSIEAASHLSVLDERERSAWEELVDVLDWACRQQLILASDRLMLLLLVEASQDLNVRIATSHGLLSNEATAEVAALLGVCERTVRRRTRRTIAAVTAGAANYRRVA